MIYSFASRSWLFALPVALLALNGCQSSDKAAADKFVAFHRAHSTRMGWVVMAPMVAELGLAAWLAWQGRALGGNVLWSLALVIFVWAVTFFISVPFHNRLAQGFDYIAIDGLVRTNWLRTLAWTARLGLLGYLLWQMIK